MSCGVLLDRSQSNVSGSSRLDWLPYGGRSAGCNVVTKDDRHLHRKGSVSRAVTSPAVNTVLAVLGLILPFVAWGVANSFVKDLLLAVEMLIVIAMASYLFWLRRAYIQLRRANAKSMSDAKYFEAIRKELETSLINDFDEIADGNLHVYAAEVPRLSVMLYRVLLEAECEPRRIVATDLTIDPRILSQRHDYLAVNQRFMEAGGVVKRIFICRLNDLVRRSFATDLLELISHHRSMGVQCGLAVREWLSAEQAVDFVVVGLAAVLIEEEQGDEKYAVGRSSVSFKSARKWAARFETIWNPELETYSAPARLRHYETAVRASLENGTWRPSVVRAGLQFRLKGPEIG